RDPGERGGARGRPSEASRHARPDQDWGNRERARLTRSRSDPEEGSLPRLSAHQWFGDQQDLRGNRLSERRRVSDTGLLPGRVEVGALPTRFGVGHGDRVLDVRKSAIENPEVAVESPAGDDLCHELDVVGAEEPKVSGVRGQPDSLAGAGGPDIWSPPGDSYEETTRIETEARGIRSARCDLLRCRSRFRRRLAADSGDHERSRVRNA